MDVRRLADIVEDVRCCLPCDIPEVDKDSIIRCVCHYLSRRYGVDPIIIYRLSRSILAPEPSPPISIPEVPSSPEFGGDQGG